MPNFGKLFGMKESVIYILAWSLFITGLQLGSVTGWQDFLSLYLFEIMVTIITVVPIFFLAQLQRDALQEISPLQACLRLVATAFLVAMIAMFFALSISSTLGWTNLSGREMVLMTTIHTINVTSFTSVFLIYYLQKHRELRALQSSFQHQLETQSNHIKARLAPHFFFNTINTLSTLVETDTKQASDFLQHVSMLFRFSFSEPTETSFEEEMTLCGHYLAIEKMRLQNKLNVTWQLPDEDILYDMTITSLTLQNVLEQTILHVVEMTVDTVNLDIKVSWENHVAMIVVTATMPKRSLVVGHNIYTRLQFNVQLERLQLHFGDEANIYTNTHTHHVTTVITYPLHDAYLA